MFVTMALSLLAAGALHAQSANPRSTPKPVRRAKAVPAATHTAAAEPEFNGRPLSAYIAELKADAPATRNAAAYAIASMGPAARSAVPALIIALGDDSPTVRYPAALALGEIGPGAESAVPALQKLVEDQNDEVGFMARHSLKKLGHPVAIPEAD
jgi:HEAT repeat protein